MEGIHRFIERNSILERFIEISPCRIDDWGNIHSDVKSNWSIKSVKDPYNFIDSIKFIRSKKYAGILPTYLLAFFSGKVPIHLLKPSPDILSIIEFRDKKLEKEKEKFLASMGMEEGDEIEFDEDEFSETNKTRENLRGSLPALGEGEHLNRPFHIVLTPTRNRPKLLKKLLLSIRKNIQIYGYPLQNVMHIIMDDSSEEKSRQENQKLVNELNRASPHPRIIYYGKKEQEEFENDLKKGYFPYVDKFVYEPKKEGEKRGFGGVRNLTLLLGIYHATRRNTILTFLDDDVVLANLVYENGRRSIRHMFSYFDRLDQAFMIDNSIVNIAGGPYTRDFYETPWMVVHLLWSLGAFFDLALQRGPHESHDDLYQIIFGAFPRPWRPFPNWSERKDPNYMGNIKTNLSLERWLKIMATSCSLMKDYGAYRLIPAVYDPAKPLILEQTPFSPGGNLSFRLWVAEQGVPYPVGGWRGEDMIWNIIMEAMVGGAHKVNIPVAHFRTHGGKRDIEKEFAKDLTYDLNKELMLRMCPELHGSIFTKGGKLDRSHISQRLQQHVDINSFGEFSQFPYSWYLIRNEWDMRDPDTDEIRKADFSMFGFAKWKEKAADVRSKMSLDAWFTKGEYKKYTKKIRDFLDYVDDDKIVERIKWEIPRVNEITDSIHLYGWLIAAWPALIHAVKAKRMQRMLEQEESAENFEDKGEEQSPEEILYSSKELITEATRFYDEAISVLRELNKIERNPNISPAAAHILGYEKTNLLIQINAGKALIQKKIERSLRKLQLLYNL